MHAKRRWQPQLEGLEGRGLLSVGGGILDAIPRIEQPREVEALARGRLVSVTFTYSGTYQSGVPRSNDIQLSGTGTRTGAEDFVFDLSGVLSRSRRPGSRISGTLQQTLQESALPATDL